MDSQLRVTGEHGLLDVSLPKHVQAIFAPPEALSRPSNVGLVLSFLRKRDLERCVNVY